MKTTKRLTWTAKAKERLTWNCQSSQPDHRATKEAVFIIIIFQWFCVAGILHGKTPYLKIQSQYQLLSSMQPPAATCLTVHCLSPRFRTHMNQFKLWLSFGWLYYTEVSRSSERRNAVAKTAVSALYLVRFRMLITFEPKGIAEWAYKNRPRTHNLKFLS